jgi:hypothetical protein
MVTMIEMARVHMLPHQVRGKALRRTTMLAVPYPVLYAEAEEATGWGGARGGNVVPRQTVEAETDE